MQGRDLRCVSWHVCNFPCRPAQPPQTSIFTLNSPSHGWLALVSIPPEEEQAQGVAATGVLEPSLTHRHSGGAQHCCSGLWLALQDPQLLLGQGTGTAGHNTAIKHPEHLSQLQLQTSPRHERHSRALQVSSQQPGVTSYRWLCCHLQSSR